MTAALPQSAHPATTQSQPLPVKEFSPEFNLLLACCAELSNQDRTARIHELLSGAPDWKKLATLAEHHGVLSQLYDGLSTTAGASTSELATIRQRYEASARQAMWLTGELLRVLDHLESRAIEALPHKGPVLAEILYGNVAMRQFSDLDVFVRAADVPRTKAALIELGYQPGIELTPREERAYLASGYEYTFDSPHGRNLLEIQWQVLPRFYSINFDMNGFFDRAADARVGGRSLRTLCIEDMLLVLCAHAAKHAWVQLSWLCDIAELAKSQSINWEIVHNEAKRLGIERIVAVSFFLARELLGTQIPVTAQLEADREALDVAKKIASTITNDTECNTESIPYFRLMMRLRERRGDRTRFLSRLVFTPSVGEWSAVRLPTVLFPLYRVVRILRLMRKVGS